MGDKFAILEIKTVIAKVLRSYRLHPVPGKTEIEPLFRITLRASGGLWVRLESRHKTEPEPETQIPEQTLIITPPPTEKISTESSCKLNGKINGLNGLKSINGLNGLNSAKHISVT